MVAAGLSTLFVLGRVPWWAPVAGAVVAVGWFVSGASAARAARRARRGHRRRVRHRELGRGAVHPGRAAAAAVGHPDEPWAEREPSWDSVPQVEVVARWGREQADTDGLDRRALVGMVRGPAAEWGGAAFAADAAPLVSPGPFPASRYLADPLPRPGALVGPAGQAGVGYGDTYGDGGAGGSESGSGKVDQPVPGYRTGPRVPRTVARIDLTCPGAWTSAGAAVAAAPTPTAAPVDRAPAAAGEPAAAVRRAPARPRPLLDIEVEGVDEATAEVPYVLPLAVGE